MYEEWLNRDLKANVGPGQTEQSCNNYLRRYNFWRVVMEGIRSVVWDDRAERRQQMKDMSEDVAILVEWFKENIGATCTWEEATAPNVDSKLGINASFALPWESDKRLKNLAPTHKDSIPTYIRRLMAKDKPWFEFLSSE